MDDIFDQIVSYEKSIKNHENEQGEDDRRFGIDDNLIHLVGLNQEQITSIFQQFFSNFQGVEINKQYFATLIQPILHIDPSDLATICSNISQVFFEKAESLDTFEFLFFIILYSKLDMLLKIEDLFDAFDYFQNKKINCIEFTLSFQSMVNGIKKAYKHHITFEEISDDDFYNALVPEPSKFPFNHDRFVDFFKSYEPFMEFLKVLTLYEELGTDADLEVECPTNGKPVVDENFLGGDEFMAVKPWKGAIFAPSNPPKINSSPPDASLTLKWAHGYRSQDCRNNLYFALGGRIVYHVAGIGISLDVKSREQTFNFSHNDDITCLTLHPKKQYVATGQLGAKPKIVVWDSITCKTKIELTNFHKRSVSCIAFSPSGRLLGSVGLDDKHSIAIYDWEKNKLIASSTGSQEVTLDCYFLTDDIFISCGIKHLFHWSLINNTIKKKNGVFNKLPITNLLCITKAPGNTSNYITGAQTGDIYEWSGNTAVKKYAAHKGCLYCCCCNGKDLYTGGKDGLIKIWGEGMILRRTIDFTLRSTVLATNKEKTKVPPEPVAIRALNPSDSNTNLIIGTSYSEIYEIVIDSYTPDTALEPIVTGNFKDELWGLAIDPKNSDQYCTVGDDFTLRIYSIKNKKQISVLYLPSMSRTVTYHPKDDIIACGIGGRVGKPTNDKNEGMIICIKKTISGNKVDLKVIRSKQDAKQWISDIKFSPNGSILAAGGHDDFIYLYQWPGLQYKCRLKGHSSYITHFDFSIDGKYLQSTCGAYELLFWDVNSGTQIKSASSLKNTQWATQTCVLGWGVQGIWPPCSDGTDVNAVDLNPRKDVLVTSDDFGQVNLFRYPCAKEKSSCSSYIGHSSHVTCVRFNVNKDVSYVISTGGNDRATFQWSFESDQDDLTPEIQSNTDDLELISNHQNNNEIQSNKTQNTEILGDEFMAVKPWLGAIFAPSNPPKINPDIPKATIDLKWIWGYQSQSSRNNLRYNHNGSYIYHCAAVGIIYNPTNKKQTFNFNHDDDILSFSIHPSLKYCATGQLGSRPKAVIWDTETGVCVKEFGGFHKRSVIVLSFSLDGKLLGTVGNDDKHSIAIYDWEKNKLISSSQGEQNVVLSCCWDTNNSFIHCGDKHLKFWEFQGQNLSSRKGIMTTTKNNKLNPKLQIFPVVLYDIISNSTVLGTNDGNLYIFTGKNLTDVIQSHKGPVMTLYVNKANGFLSGGKDGKIILYDMNFNKRIIYDLNNINTTIEPTTKQNTSRNVNIGNNNNNSVSLKYPLLSLELASLCWSEDNKKLLIGTKGSDIIELNYNNNTFSLANDYMHGHYADELWGLAIHPSQPYIVTTGDDKTIKCFNSLNNEHVSCVKTDMMMRALAFHPNGDALVIGCGGRVGRGSSPTDGTILILSWEVNKMEIKGKIKKAAAWISEIKFSPNKDRFAVGSHDDRIYIFNWSRWTPTVHKILKGHSSYITHFDFSIDGKYLQSTCGAYELLFWDVNSGTQIKSPSSLCNTQWATQTCVLGWPVQGIWPPCSDGTDVNAVDYDKDYKLLVTSDDFGQVKLFNYPCVNKGSNFVEGRGHSSHVTCVRWGITTGQFKQIITTGGNDRGIFQWLCSLDSSNGITTISSLNEDVDDFNDETNISKSSTTQGKSTEILGDEFMAVKPWLGAIFAPSKLPDINPSLPSENLVIERVFGYRAQGSRDNLKYNVMGEIVYHVAAIGVIQPTTGNQKYNLSHGDDILCLAIDNNLEICATGEIGPYPLINIWDSTSGENIISFKKTLQKGIMAIAFSPNGSKLLAIGQDANHSMAIYGVGTNGWKNGKLLGTNKGDGNVCLFAYWFDDNTCITGGTKHGLTWNCGNFTSKRLLFGKFPVDTLVCARRVGNSLVCGTNSGNLYVFNGNTCSDSKNAHSKNKDGPVYCLCNYGEGFISGAKNGTVIVWNRDLQPITTIKLNELNDPKNKIPLCQDYGPASLTCNNTETKLLIGTLSSDIFEVNISKKGTGVVFTDPSKLATGHYRDELWGCTVHPKNPDIYVSSGDDNTVRIWSLSKAEMIDIIKTPSMARSVDFNPSGNLLAIGLGGRMGGTRASENSGGFLVYSYPKLQLVGEFNNMCTKQISDVRFSPDSKLFALGSHDTKIYVFSTSDYTKSLFSLNKGHSYVTHIDFSNDNKYMQVTYGDYELLFYSMSNGQQITSPSSLKNTQWATQTCVLGWPVQGIWADTSDGTDINYTYKSSTSKLLCAGDDFGNVRLYRYPVLTKAHKYKTGKGHSSHVPMTKFTVDDSHIISTGGNDRAVIIWKVEV